MITVGTPMTVGDTATFEHTTQVSPTGNVTFTLYSDSRVHDLDRRVGSRNHLDDGEHLDRVVLDRVVGSRGGHLLLARELSG